MAVATHLRWPPSSPAGLAANPSRRRQRVAGVVAGAVILVGVVLRFVATSDLWADEAISVAIARLPLADLVDALRQDGSPPLYYLALHGWIGVFGDGDVAVRSLSGLCSVATLPLAWALGRRHGRPTALAAVVLVATSPFAIRYATEARMYSLVVLLVGAGWWTLASALDRPSPGRLVRLAVLSGLLLLTHYWSIYLLVAVMLVLGASAWRGRGSGAGGPGRPPLLALAAVAAGAILFLPWAPSFVFQATNTGTPWGAPARPATLVIASLLGFGGADSGEAQALAIGLLALVALALFGRAVDGRRIELDLRTRPEVRGELVVIALTFGVAAVGSYLGSVAFAARYAAVVFVPFVVVAAVGASRLQAPALRAGVLGTLALLGLVGGVHDTRASRTQAGALASAIAAEATEDDLVAYCPDQLGPAVARLLPAGTPSIAFPGGSPADRVDWSGYLDRVARADPARFAGRAAERAGPGAVWLVWSEDHQGLGRRCEDVVQALTARRPAPAIVVSPVEEGEHAWLYRFDPPS